MTSSGPCGQLCSLATLSRRSGGFVKGQVVGCPVGDCDTNGWFKLVLTTTSAAVYHVLLWHTKGQVVGCTAGDCATNGWLGLGADCNFCCQLSCAAMAPVFAYRVKASLTSSSTSRLRLPRSSCCRLSSALNLASFASSFSVCSGRLHRQVAEDAPSLHIH